MLALELEGGVSGGRSLGRRDGRSRAPHLATRPAVKDRWRQGCGGSPLGREAESLGLLGERHWRGLRGNQGAET